MALYKRNIEMTDSGSGSTAKVQRNVYGTGQKKAGLVNASSQANVDMSWEQENQSMNKKDLHILPGTEILYQNPPDGSAASVASDYAKMKEAEKHWNIVNDSFAQGRLIDMQVKNSPQGAQQAYAQAQKAYAKSFDQYRQEQDRKATQVEIAKIGVPTIDQDNMFYSVLKEEAIQAEREPYRESTLWKGMLQYDSKMERVEYLGSILEDPVTYLSLGKNKRQALEQERDQLRDELDTFWTYGADLGHDMKNLHLIAQMQNDYNATARTKEQVRDVAEDSPAVAWGGAALLAPWNGLAFASQSAQMLRNRFLPESEQRPVNIYNDAHLPLQISEALEDGLRSSVNSPTEEKFLDTALNVVRHGSNLAAGYWGANAIGVVSKDAVAVLTSILDGTGKGGKKFMEEKERGSDDHVALRKALVEAATEVVTQSPVLERILSRSSADGRTGIFQSGIEKGTQEGVETVIAKALDYCLSGKESDFNRTVELYQEQGYSRKEAEKEVLKIYGGETLLAGASGLVSGLITQSGVNLFDRIAQERDTRKLVGKLVFAANQVNELFSEALGLPKDNPANVIARQKIEEYNDTLHKAAEYLEERLQNSISNSSSEADYQYIANLQEQLENVWITLADQNSFAKWLDSETIGLIEHLVNESVKHSSK